MALPASEGHPIANDSFRKEDRVRRTFVVLGSVALLWLGATGGVASADPRQPPNGHNCAGGVVSQLAGPGFGQVVSDAAQQQAVDNFGLANCQTNRKNP
jgi:hypothetical protein